MFHHLRKLLLSLVPTKGTRTSTVFLPPLPLQHLSNADHLQTHKLDSMGLWTELNHVYLGLTQSLAQRFTSINLTY
jgi:hypothetical protein